MLEVFEIINGFTDRHQENIRGRPGFDSVSTIPTPADRFDSDFDSGCLGLIPTPIPTPADFCNSDSNSSCLSSIPTPNPVQLLIPMLTPAQLFL